MGLEAKIGLGLLVCASASPAAFIDTFDGTTLDSGTYETYLQSSTISQNGQLNLNALADPTPTTFGSADYTTKATTVGVGGYVQVDETLTARRMNSSPYSYADDVHLILTNNSNGTSASTIGDSYYIGTSESFNSTNAGPGFFESEYSSGGGGAGSPFGPSPVVGQTYRLTLQRTSSTLITSTVQNLSGGPIYTTTTIVPANTVPLFVSLVAINTTASFDNLIIGAGSPPTPEPTSLGLAAAATGLLLRRRR